jgi:hypothetical protein
MKRIVTVTLEQVRRITIRQTRGTTDTATVAEVAHSSTNPNPPQGEILKKKLLAALVFLAFSTLPVYPQGPPFAAGLQTPTRLAFTPQGNVVVTEAGTTAENSGRVSIIDRTNGTRRTLIDGLPSGISGSGAEAAPSGPADVAIQSSTLYVVIGAGDGVLPGPNPGTEQPNDSPASPILSSLLSLQLTTPVDLASGGFTLLPGDHTRLKNGETLTLHGANDSEMTVKLVADFPNHTPSFRPDFPANVRAGNPFGVVVLGQTAFVVDASQNLIRRVDTVSGTFDTLTTFAAIQNPLPFGPPFIDPVPDSIALRGNHLLVTTLTGFPFPPGRAEVRKVNIATGENTTYISGLTSAIDVQPLGEGDSDPLLVLEFSTNMTQSAPGRLRLVNAAGASTTIAEGLPTPTSIAADPRSGDIFIAHIFPGLITRRNAAGTIPAAPPTAIVPVVASLPGAFGSHFTTSMQIANPHPFPISGRLVVHPQGVAGTANDPAVAYVLAPFATRDFADFMATAGATGGGSVDVVAAVGSAPVTVTTIVDTAVDGRPAVQVPQVDPADALTAGSRGTLIAPHDAAGTRFNIGIRTLAQETSITFRLHDANGTELHSSSHTFPAHYFYQFAAADLVGMAPGANQSIVIAVESGSAIAYGAALDNETGNATLQIAGRTKE